MNILFTVFDISNFGGVERVVANLANAFSEVGHKVEILSFYQANQTISFYIDKKIKVHFLHTNISKFAFDEYMNSQILRKFFYRNFYKHYLNMRVHSMAKKFDITIANDNLYTPFLKRKNVRYIRIIHETFKKYRSRNKYFHTLVVLTKQDLLTYQKYYKRDIVLIPNFLPSVSNQNTDLSQKVVLSAGRFSEEKGFLRLIDIWVLVQDSIKKDYPHLNEWQLHIVGDGVLKQEIESKIKDKNLQDSILLKPFTKDIESEYLAASIYAMASHFEGFGMVLVEAGSYALPCIAFDVATGPSDIIENNKSGYLIQDNDLHTYAHKLIELMSDENKRKTMGETAKARVAHKFSKEAIMPLWEEVLQR